MGVVRRHCSGLQLHTHTHTPGKMRGSFLLMCLIGLTIAEDMPKLTEDETMMVNEMMDVIESGLGNPEDKRDRALFISLTLTSTSTDLMTATVTETVTASCYSPTLSECTTTTTTTTTTVTFSVGLACTTAGFMFSIPAC